MNKATRNYSIIISMNELQFADNKEKGAMESYDRLRPVASWICFKKMLYNRIF